MTTASQAIVDTFALPKTTGTYADALAAFGLQGLLYLLSGSSFSLRDVGREFVLSCAHGEELDLDSLDYELVRTNAGYRYIRLEGDDSPPLSDEIVYEHERENLLGLRNLQNLIKAEKRPPTTDEEEQFKQLAPMPNWSLYQNVNVLQGFGSYVSLHRELRAASPDRFARAVRNELAERAIPAVMRSSGKGLAVTVSAVQTFNPTVGKGVSEVKPTGTALGPLPGPFVHWFAEWLRYMGLGVAARSVAIEKDFKIFVMAPRDLREEAVGAVSADFLSVPSSYSSAKADVLLSIRLATNLIRHSGLIGNQTGDQVGIQRRRPSEVVSGLHTAYFQRLSRFSCAVSNISFVGLPGWFPVEEDSVSDWLDTLGDHDRILRFLDERHTEEANLLTLYRDFLSAGPELVTALLEFLSNHAIYVFHCITGDKRVATLRLSVLDSFLRRLFVDQEQNLEPVLASQGFRRVASAIRRSTITEQFRRANKQRDPEYEIRYGLLQELKRAARFKHQFIADLSDFVASYNAENARKVEQYAQAGRELKYRRHQVTTDDLLDVVHLLDTHRPETVAMLLLAYASASDARPVSTGDGAAELRPPDSDSGAVDVDQ